MKKLQLAMTALALVAAVVYWGSRIPAEPTTTFMATVVSVVELDAKSGKRAVTVRYANGEEKVIETLRVNFLKPGYSVRVAIYKTPLFGETFDLLGDSVPDISQMPEGRTK